MVSAIFFRPACPFINAGMSEKQSRVNSEEIICKTSLATGRSLHCLRCGGGRGRGRRPLRHRDGYDVAAQGGGRAVVLRLRPAFPRGQARGRGAAGRLFARPPLPILPPLRCDSRCEARAA